MHVRWDGSPYPRTSCRPCSRAGCTGGPRSGPSRRGKCPARWGGRDGRDGRVGWQASRLPGLQAGRRIGKRPAYRDACCYGQSLCRRKQVLVSSIRIIMRIYLEYLHVPTETIVCGRKCSSSYVCVPEEAERHRERTTNDQSSCVRARCHSMATW